MSATLLVLAAGIGSRFKGGIKQLTPVGKNGELLMEYSVFDAVEAGFDNVIFIIRRDIEHQFKELIGDKLSKHVNVNYCFQELDELPRGYILPEERTKPWGTVHAVLAAKKLINEPFLIINADDYYGKEAYKKIYDFLISNNNSTQQCMGGFVLKNTLSSTGTVTRGVCTSDSSRHLLSVTETYKLEKNSDGIIRGTQDNTIVTIDENSIVSMNMWGFKKEIIPMLEKCFDSFIRTADEKGTLSTDELALPTAVDTLIRNGSITVEVLSSNDKWYGMTHKEDMQEILSAFEAMTDIGTYTSPLHWNKTFIY